MDREQPKVIFTSYGQGVSYSPSGAAPPCLTTRCCSWRVSATLLTRARRNPLITDCHWCPDINGSWQTCITSLQCRLHTNIIYTTCFLVLETALFSLSWESQCDCDLEINLPQKSSTRHLKIFKDFFLCFHIKWLRASTPHCFRSLLHQRLEVQSDYTK